MLKDLVAEAKANEKVLKAKVRTTLRSSHSSYYLSSAPPSAASPPAAQHAH
jgi:hypothetical protein